MKTSLALILLGFLLCMTNLQGQEFLDILDREDLTYDEIVVEADAYFDDRGRGKHIGYKQYLRWQYWAQRNLDERGYVIGDTRTSDSYERFRSKNPTTYRNATNWQELGPLSATNTSTWSSHIGRLTNVAIDPNNSNHLIVTSPGGGVWRTLDEGLTWTPIFDGQSTLDCYAALISEANADHYLVSTAGSGTYRSTDAGVSWTKVNNINNDRVYAFMQDPDDSNIMFAASRNGEVYRSIDAGVNWTISLNQNQILYDIEFHPGDNNIIYAAGENGVLFKSTDNGQSFTQIVGPWASQAIMIAVTPDRPDMVYLLQELSGGFGALYLSSDAGASWTLQSNNGSAGNIMGYDTNQGGGQAPRDMDIIVSPTDSTEVHIAGIMTWRSNNKGVDWTQTTHWVLSNPLPFVHADIDQLIYRGNKIYVASDGGIFISSDGGNSFVDRTTGLGIRQFYRIGAATTIIDRINGGSQDNGTGIVKNGVWFDWLGADGMEAIILDQNADIIFGSIQFGDLRKSVNGGVSTSGISQTQNGESGNWVTPLAKDPNYTNTIYQGKRHLYKSTSAGNSWIQISDVNNGNSRLNELAIANTDSRRIYMSYGTVLLTSPDGGETWDTITPPSPAFINYISVHPSDEERIVLSMNGGDRIRESTNAGITWSSVSNNIPSLGANCTIYDGKGSGGMYAAMTRGIYYRDDSNSQWSLISTGVPNANVTELEIVGDKLYAATYGRGLWAADLPGASCHINALATVSACDNQGTSDPTDDTYTFNILSNGIALGISYDISGDVTATGLAYDTDHLINNGGNGLLVSSGPLQLTLSDVNGSCSKSIMVYPPDDCLANNSCLSADTITESGTYLADAIVAGNGATQNNATNAEWYRFTPPIDGAITIRSCGYGIDTRFHIHEGACGSLVNTFSYDDQCIMSQGEPAYASEVVGYRVVGGTTYFIEWDDRWSAEGFSWDFIYDPDYDLSECPDQVIVNLDGLTQGEYFGVDRLQLAGSAEADLTAKATYQGAVVVDQSFNASAGIVVNVVKDSCIVNDTLDWLIIGGGSVPIVDNDTSIISLEVPTFLDDTITDLDIEIDLNHTYIGDLVIELVTPTNDTLLLWNRYCGGEDGLHFILDEQAENKAICGQDWRAGKAIKSQGVMPVTALLPYMNVVAVGTWQVVIYDRASADTGQVNKIALRFKARP